MLKSYYYLTKPGIIYGNVLTAIAGFLLAAGRDIDFGLLVATIVGTAMIIACGCVINNYLDRDIDKHMARTHKRALVTGTISKRAALVYATLLGFIGFAILLIWVNKVTALVGAIGLIDYAVIYTYSKRHTVYSTLIGSISGSASIVGGYTAVTGTLDAGAIILFLIMATLQMPHFYAISIYRLKDYKAAKLPVLSVIKGVSVAKLHTVTYIAAFTAICCLLTIYGYTGYVYLIVVTMLNIGWLRLALKGYKSGDDVAWAKSIFGYSLIVILGISIIIPAGGLLP